MYYTFKKDELISLRNFLNEREQGLNEILNEFKSIYPTDFDIFLTHRFKDKKLVEALFFELNIRGKKVYVDWICDTQLNRKNINCETAEVIRNRIKQSRCLIYVTSVKKDISKWMPWECGLMDAGKGNVAILPITENDQNDFKGEEFLSLYPIIKKDLYGNLVVEIIPGKIIPFDDWINKVERPPKSPFFSSYLYSYMKIFPSKHDFSKPAFGIGTYNIKNNVLNFIKNTK